MIPRHPPSGAGRRPDQRRAALPGALAAWLLAAVALCADSANLVVRTPAQRLERAHLRAAHDTVARIALDRQAVPPVPGLNDYRCSFHAHAEDAVHTGGTRPEMLADARRAGMHAIFLSDHFRPPRDFMASWRGLRDGVLFVPGSEVRGFLAHPDVSVMASMEAKTDGFVAAIGAGTGMIFLSHIEERPDHSMEGLTGLEIYNRHYDAKRDIAGLVAIAMKLTDPVELAEFAELAQLYPDEILASQVRRADAYLEKWDGETARGRRLTGVAANDCHHNQVMIVKMVDASTVRVGTIVDKDEDMRTVSALLRPGIKRLTAGHQPGDTLARLDLDPYYRSFRNVSTHVLAPELTEAALRKAVHAGRVYVAHEWLCDATGFRFELVQGGKTAARMGDEIPHQSGLVLQVLAPAPCRIRLLRNGGDVTIQQGRELTHTLREPGAYRCELSFEIEGEQREWIYSNPIYVR